MKVEGKTDLVDKLDYYERLLDYLGDVVPCLSELIAQFDEDENVNEDEE